MTVRTGSAPLVGREAVVAGLWAHVEASVDDGMRAVVLRGPAGVGKTRVLDAFAERARDSGAAVIAGRSPAVGGFAFGALSDALAAYVRGSPPAGGQVRRAGDGLRRLVPQLTAGDEDTPGDTPGVLAVVQAAYRLVRQVTERRPLVVVLDDTQVADAETCEVLWSLRRQTSELPWVLMLGVRHPADEFGEAPRRLLAELQREHDVTHVELGPLDRAGTGALMAALLADGLPGPSFVDMVHRRTDGNPYYVEEMVRWLRFNQRLRRQGLQWIASTDAERELPPSVEEALGVRIRALPETALDVLAWVSAAGGRADAALLLAVVDLDERALGEAVDRLVAAGLVAEVAGRSAEYRVHHPLVAECSYGELSAARRRHVHRALAMTLAARGASPAVVATHFAESADAGDPDAVAAAFRAAEEAEGRYHFARAVAWYQQVVALGVEPATELRMRALDRISELGAITGRAAAGLAAVDELLEHAAADDLPRRVTLLRRLAALRSASGDVDGARAAIDEGLALAPQGGPETALLIFGLARIALQAFRVPEFKDIVRRGIAAASRAGPGAQHVAIMLRSFEACAVTYGGDPRRGADMALEAGRMAVELEEPVAAGYCVFSRSLANNLLGRCEEAADAFSAMVEPAEEVGLVWEGASTWAERAEALLYVGDLDAAFDSCLRSEEIARRHEGIGTLAQPVLTEALILTHRNDVSAARERLREARLVLDRRPDLVFESWYWYVHGQLADAVDDPKEAATSYARMATNAAECGVGSLVVFQPAHVHALLACKRYAEALVVAQDTVALLDGLEQPRAHAFAALALGAALIASHDVQSGIAQVDSGLSQADALQGAFLPAHARLLAGEALARAGERRRARELVGDAAARLGDIGAAWLAERARAQLRRLGVTVMARDLPEPGTSAGLDPLRGLTSREREAVELAARGLSSKAIALHLGISERTVENHIGNAYSKLRLHSRAGLIALLAHARPADESGLAPARVHTAG